MSKTFFTQKTCDRCGGDLNGVRTMSKFNTDRLCMPCKEKETKHPAYKAADEAEWAAVRSGNCNFMGVGCPPDLK
jgi:hypothetical protein